MLAFPHPPPASSGQDRAPGLAASGDLQATVHRRPGGARTEASGVPPLRVGAGALCLHVLGGLLGCRTRSKWGPLLPLPCLGSAPLSTEQHQGPAGGGCRGEGLDSFLLWRSQPLVPASVL